MHPSLWNRVNLTNQTTWPHDLLPLLQHPIFMLPSKLNFFFSWLASLIHGYLKATQLFSPIHLSSLHTVCVEMLLLSLLNITLSSTVVFLPFDFTIPPFQRLSDRQSRSIRIFFRPHFFLEDDGSPLSFQFLIMRLTVLNTIAEFLQSP